MTKLSDKKTRHDHFHKKAKTAGFLARAIFKLEEIDDKVGILRPGDRVCDLGCAPGSWLQYAGRRVGPSGALVGIDRAPLRDAVPRARLLVGDVYTVTVEELLGDLLNFDVVLSDMAPDTSGVRFADQAKSEALFERALEIAHLTLAPGGAFVGKIFQGPDFQNLIKACRASFEKVKMIKPEGSRTRSIEQYIACTGFRGSKEL